MGATRGNYSDQFLTDALPLLEGLIYEEYEKQPDHVPDVFNVLPSSSWGEQSSTTAGPAAATEKVEGDPSAESNPLQGYDKTYTHLTYSVLSNFSYELVQDDRLGFVQKSFRQQGMSLFQTEQVTAWNVFNNGFADVGPDGGSLFNTAHTMIDGGSYANRPSTDIALSIAGIREMEVDLARQINHRNLNILVMPYCVIVPPEQMQTGEELIGSPDRPDTANRAINTFYKKNYKLKVIPFLTSTTAWFATTMPDYHELRFYRRQAPETDTWIDRPTRDVVNSTWSRISVGYSDYIGSWGTSG